MRFKKILLAALLIVSTAVQAQMMPPIPIDKSVRMGKLENGLTYYVRQNGWPEKRVNFYIAQRVGSLQENDQQRGLAHFLEHMAFNGSDNFKGNNLIEYTRSLGVEFGSDLNAYTGIDETVYRISNVPSTRVSAIDSCLLILKDWSNGLLLEEDEIDKERGVIHEEWRLRSSASQRMFERNLETIYPGSKYGLRMPIGKMEIVDNFEPKVLRDYYHKWYHPENQAIIVVGDIDVDRTEQKIKELFSGIKLPENRGKVEKESVPDNAEPIIIVDKDKEQQTNVIMAMFKHDTTPDEEKSNMMYLIEGYLKQIACEMLNQRLTEKSLDAGCPYIHAGVNDEQYIYASTKDCFGLTIMPKEGRSEEALATAYREVLRAIQFGFTPTEYARAKSEYMSRLEKQYTNRDKITNASYGDDYTHHYLKNEPIPSMDDYYAIMNQIVPNIPVDPVNEVLAQLVSKTDSNVVVLNFNTEKDGVTYPTKEGYLKAMNDVRAEQLTAYVDNVKDEPLITKFPKKGKIKSEKMNDKFGYKELTLSNGARVILKKTDYKADEVRMMAISKGGSSLLPESDVVNYKLIDAVIGASGLGNFDNMELEKALAGKQASAGFSLSNLHESVNANCLPKDIETMMQLVYLNFTDIKKDEKAYGTLVSMLENALKNKDLSPESAFSDSVQSTLYSRNPRFTSMNLDDLKKLNYDRCLQIAKERLANAGDFTFYFVGNFDEATLRPLIEQYIASLPGNAKKAESWKKVSTYKHGETLNRFYRKMETPKAHARIYWFNDQVPYSLENAVAANAAAEVLSMIYIQKIREEASAAYSAGAYGGVNLGGDLPYNFLVGDCPMKPEMAYTAINIMREEAFRLTQTVDADMLNKVKEAFIKNYETNTKRNGYWMDVISDYDELGVDKHTDYRKVVESLTPAKVSEFMKNVIFNNGNSVEVVMLPEESK